MAQLVWHSNIFDYTGYAKAARQYVLALHASGVDVKLETIQAQLPDVDLPADQMQILRHLAMKRKHSQRKVYLYHYIPDLWWRSLHPSIGFTYWETSKLPQQWVYRANKMNAVFLPSTHNMEVFHRSGIKVPLFHIRPCLHLPEGSESQKYIPSYIHGLPPFRFLAVCSWIERKGIDLLLKAFWSEFHESEPVSLVIKTVAGPDIANSVEALKQEARLSHPPAVVYVDTQVRSELEMDALYRSCHAFVHPTRGEGVGYPMMEAVARGLPVIATNWGGQLDYLNANNSYLIPCHLVPVKPQAYYYGYQSDQLWAEPSIEALRALMRQVINEYHTAALKAQAAQQYLYQHFTPQAAAQDMLQALQQLTSLHFQA